MKINFGKCINLTANGKQSNFEFLDGTRVPRKDKATYLGAILSVHFDNKSELDSRIAAVNVTANKLKLFWHKAENPTYWKIRVLDAVLRSKLL